MCTVTITQKIDASGEPVGWRLLGNRDEVHERPAARPPRITTVDDRRVIMPIDPPSGGTWIAVNDAGLVATLLNKNFERRPTAPTPPQSRGGIIPTMMGAHSVWLAEKMVSVIDPGLFAPFRLVLLDDQHMTVAASDGEKVVISRDKAPRRPVMFASSGLGDAVVDAPRRALFEQMFADQPPSAWADIQDRYHRHSWPENTPHSVCMHRHAAKTVSLTTVETDPHFVLMRYHGAPPDEPYDETERSLKRARMPDS